MATDGYDAFISYSHAADDLLAPRLQSGLQRFARPWWRRRALRIFRDESSLSANPHLWSSITDALDASEWFVLLLSPQAARSEWVNQEIEYWVAHKDPDRILPVVTDGDFGWSGGDVSGTAVPESLRGVFGEEPRWVDMRFARHDEQLDLKNPTFSAAVLDLASPIRGIPKDELESEEVRQHRRTIRTAWGAGVALLGLAVATAIATVLAVGQRNEARSLADAEATARAEADANADEAAANAQQAEESARLARARELAAAAIGVVDEDPQLAILLALEAFEARPEGTEPEAELESALHEAVHASALLDLAPLEDAYSYVDVSPDGRLLAVSSGRTLTMRDAETLEVLWTYSEDTVDTFEYIGFSTEGEHLTLTIADQHWYVANHRQYPRPWGNVVADRVGDDGDRARLIVFDPQSGDVIRRLDFEDDVCAPIAVPGSFSDGLRLLAVGLDRCDYWAPGDDGGHEVAIYDTSTWEIVHRRPAWEGGHGVFPISESAGIVAVMSGWTDVPSNTTVLDVTTWEPVFETGDYAFGALSPDGTLLAGVHPNAAVSRPDLDDGGISIVDVATGTVLQRLYAGQTLNLFAIRFSRDGQELTVGTTGRRIRTFSLATGKIVADLPAGETISIAPSSDRLYATGGDGELEIWDRTRILEGELLTRVDLPGLANTVLRGGDTTLLQQLDVVAGGAWFIAVGSEGLLGEPYPLGPLPAAPIGGDRLVEFGGSYEEPGPLRVVDLQTMETRDLAGCTLPLTQVVTGALCEDGRPHPIGWLYASADGSEFMRVPIDDLSVPGQPSTVTIWSATTLEPIESIVIDDVGREYVYGRGMVTADHILLWDAVQSEIVVFDRATGEELLALRGDHPLAIDRSGGTLFYTAHDVNELRTLDLETLEMGTLYGPIASRLIFVNLSPDGHRAALLSRDIVTIVEVGTGETLNVIPVSSIDPSELMTAVTWIDDSHVGVGGTGGFWTVITLDFEELVDIARSRLVRGLTVEECALYRIDCDE